MRKTCLCNAALAKIFQPSITLRSSEKSSEPTSACDCKLDVAGNLDHGFSIQVRDQDGR